LDERKYDGVFIGRFHVQKGVLELIDVWELVVKNKPFAKLVMIGDGDLFPEVKDKIDKKELSSNIILLVSRQEKIFMRY